MPPRPPRRIRRVPQRTSVHIRGRITAVRGPLIIVTDTDEDPYGISGGYLATSGHYGFAAHAYPTQVSEPDRTTVAELRAVELALHAVGPNARTPARICCGSTDAVAWLHRWKNGDSELPEGSRALRTHTESSALSQLQLCAEHMPNLQFEHMEGHAGQSLREAAGALARLGLRTSGGVVPEIRAGELARVWTWHYMDLYSEARRQQISE